MPDKLQEVVEYRRLAAKRDTGRDEDLAPGDWYRLAALGDRLPKGVPAAGAVDGESRLQPPLEVSLSVGAQRLVGLVRHLTVDGLGIAVDPPPPLGATAVIHVALPQGRVEYRLVGRVVGRVLKGETAVSIALEGEARLAPRERQTSGVHRAGDPFGASEDADPDADRAGRAARKAIEGS